MIEDPTKISILNENNPNSTLAKLFVMELNAQIKTGCRKFNSAISIAKKCDQMLDTYFIQTMERLMKIKSGDD